MRLPNMVLGALAVILVTATWFVLPRVASGQVSCCQCSLCPAGVVPPCSADQDAIEGLCSSMGCVGLIRCAIGGDACGEGVFADCPALPAPAPAVQWPVTLGLASLMLGFGFWRLRRS